MLIDVAAGDDQDHDGLDEALLRSPRFRLALVLLVLNYALGWPVVALAAGASPWIGVETAAVVGTGSYALSWAVLGVAVLLGGREVVEYGERWWRRRRAQSS